MKTYISSRPGWSLPIILSTLLGSSLLFGPLAWSQQDNNPSETDAGNGDAAAIEAPEKVDVKPEARDEEIAQRLEEILIATQWFSGVSVRVEDGVVFLNGEAVAEEYRQWATDLASNTQDVAAVVNRMDMAEKSIWDFGVAFARLTEFRNTAIQAIPLIIFAVVILLVTWFLARLSGAIANRALKDRLPNNLLRWVATRAIMLPILIFGVYLVLRIAGLTQLALTVLGGTGLVGLIIGIAFQDIAENFLASVLISIQKPFRIGDLIVVENHEGVVQRVTTRGTLLLTPDGNHVQIPNSKIYKNTIENFTANPLRRLGFSIGIGYDDPTSKAQQIVLQKIQQHTVTLNDPPPKVLLQGLGAATVNLQVLFWIDGTKHDWNSVLSSCMRVSKQALMKAGISLPDEAREVIFPNGVPVKMESKGHPEDVPGQASESDRADGRLSHGSGTPTADESEAIEKDASEAEGNMESELDDLKRQAEQAWLPGEGEELLVGEE